MQRTLTVLLCTGLALAPWAASQAQNPQTAPPGNPHPATALPSAPTPPPEKLSPAAKADTNRTTLSDRLAQQNGTLPPPKTGDRGAVIKPHQEAGNMPVIPPPGSKGGNQRVQPK